MEYSYIDENFKINNKVGFRINSAYNNSQLARIYTDFNNYGITPSLIFHPTDQDEIRVDYSFFHELRTPDKGNLIINPKGKVSNNNFVNKSLTNSFVRFKQDFRKKYTSRNFELQKKN